MWDLVVSGKLRNFVVVNLCMFTDFFMDIDVVYEDNHLIVVNKRAGEIVQGDKSGDEPLVERVRQYIKETYA